MSLHTLLHLKKGSYYYVRYYVNQRHQTLYWIVPNYLFISFRGNFHAKYSFNHRIKWEIIWQTRVEDIVHPVD